MTPLPAWTVAGTPRDSRHAARRQGGLAQPVSFDREFGETPPRQRDAAAGFLVRLFMIQHDCGHGSFFRRRLTNDWVGRVTGVLTLTPHDFWRHSHALHHANSGNLDHRGFGEQQPRTLIRGLERSVPTFRRLPQTRLRFLVHDAETLLGLTLFLKDCWSKSRQTAEPWYNLLHSSSYVGRAPLVIALFAPTRFSQIGISGSAPASNRATNGFSIEMGAKPLPPLRASWRSLAPDVRVFNKRR
jgi:Fatty acid desaturase